MNRPSRISELLKNQYLLLFILWFILTAINVNKAFHIDDTFHLEASKYLKDNPTKPMSGLIIWGDNPAPLHEHNQPPLFFYLIAFVSSIFGTSEIPLHLFLSVFTFLGLYFFQKIAFLLTKNHTNTLLVLFAFCPAFIINQNLMVDVPILSIILGMAYFLIKSNYSNKLIYYVSAALLLGIGLLIKYSILPLIIVLTLVIIVKRDYNKLFVVLIPITILALWSYWNFIEYGSVHILDRPKGVIHINQFWAFMACLGSISTFSISFVFGAFRSKMIRGIVSFVLIIFIASIVLFYFDLVPESQYSHYLNLIFIFNGFVVCITLFMIFFKQLKKGLATFLLSDRFIILLFLSSLGLFIILFAPFMSTRHILLIIPFALLFGSELISKALPVINQLSIVMTIVLGLLLGISDWVYADYYRQMASSINMTNDNNVWSAGHWGWQWYAKQKGLNQYNPNKSDVRVGDYFIYPLDVSPQIINENIQLDLVEKKWQEASLLTFFSGNNFASMYNSTVEKPPWNLSKSPIDTIYVCKVKKISSEKVSTKQPNELIK